MNAWAGLLKKEFRLTRTLVLSGLVFLVLFFIAIQFLPITHVEEDPRTKIAMIGLAIVPFVFHMFYLAGYMLYSLIAESKKLHLWLHNPQPAVNLLGAKILNGVLAITMSMTLSAFILYYSISKMGPYLPFDLSLIPRGIIIIAVGIIVGALLYSMWIVAAWTIYQTCKTYIGNWSILVAVGFLVVSSIISGLFEQTKFYALLTDWGHISIGELFNLHSISLPPEFSIDVMPTFPVGMIVYHVVISAIIFMLSCWLLDRKVEV